MVVCQRVNSVVLLISWLSKLFVAWTLTSEMETVQRLAESALLEIVYKAARVISRY